MFFILNGRCSAAYSLASEDKAAQFLGKVNKDVDRPLKEIISLNILKSNILDKLDTKGEDLGSEKSCHSRRSSISRISQNRRNSRRQSRLGSATLRKGNQRIFITSEHGRNDDSQEKSKRHPIMLHVKTLTKMIENLTDKAGETSRTNFKRDHDPLNQVIDRMHNAIV